MIVVASNDNESSQVTLPGFSICLHVPVIRGLTRFLIMAEVAISYEEGKGGDHYRKENKFRCQVSRIEKCLVKLKERTW